MPEGKGKRHTPEQIVKILREVDSEKTVVQVCSTYNIGEQTFYSWRKQYRGMELSDVRELKQLKEENARLKRLVADQALKTRLRTGTFQGRFGNLLKSGFRFSTNEFRPSCPSSVI
jgi:putative transposase